MKIAIVVNSCDFFKDCWKPFIYSMQRYWPDCEWPVYIVSNYESIDAPNGFSFIKVGEDKKFSSNLKTALRTIDADYVIYMQEDYWLTTKVNNNAISKHLEFCENNDIDYLRLSFPYLNGDLVNETYRVNSLRQKYSLCLQAAIWEKNTFDKFLIEGDSGWDFEYKIQQYAIDHNIRVNALCLDESVKDLGLNYVVGTAVRKGRWTREGFKFLNDNGFDDLITKRDVEGWIFGTFQEVHGPLRPLCLTIVKVMKYFKWNF